MGSALCSPVLMFPRPYVPQYLCSPNIYIYNQWFLCYEVYVIS